MIKSPAERMAELLSITLMMSVIKQTMPNIIKDAIQPLLFSLRYPLLL